MPIQSRVRRMFQRADPLRAERVALLRAISLDMVENANSGHPGMPLGMADIAECLWYDTLSHNPVNPNWPNRDRFVLSNGHGSALLYALLHLTGYQVSLKDLMAFRQLGSITPGHPERGLTPGVDATTGPLGQGLANAVGMAIAERQLAARFNRPKYRIIDHHCYVFAGDGCMMEGISHEACSLAGRLGLGKLIVFYDDNGISIDGPVDAWLGEDVSARFAAYDWQVLSTDGHDFQMVQRALDSARGDSARPSLIRCKTVIGYGAPNKQGTAAAHGSPLGPEEAQATRAALGWRHRQFVVPPPLRESWDARAQGEQHESQWYQRMEAYRADHPDLADELERRLEGRLAADWHERAEAATQAFQRDGKRLATRHASRLWLSAVAPAMPELLGGSADLSDSNGTKWDGCVVINEQPREGNYLHYGVREFAMSAIVNGIALHGGFKPFCGTFLAFLDYARSAVRLAALSGAPGVFVYSHDSVGLGEDGPTHQPVEQLTTLRCTPGLSVWRPCDAVETAIAWRELAQRQDGPGALVLSRQALDTQPRDEACLAGIARGGYVLRSAPGGAPEIVIIATGSEVAVAVAALESLVSGGIAAQLVSMPSVDRFEAQDAAWRDAVLAPGVPRLAVEASHQDYWRKFVGADGAVVGLSGFGASGPGAEVLAHFGISAEAVCRAARAMLGRA